MITSHKDQIAYLTMAIHIAIGFDLNLIYNNYKIQDDEKMKQLVLQHHSKFSNWPLAFYIFIKSHYTRLIRLEGKTVLACDFVSNISFVNTSPLFTDISIYITIILFMLLLLLILLSLHCESLPNVFHLLFSLNITSKGTFTLRSIKGI